MAFRIVCLKAACTAAVVVLLLAACLPSTPQAIHRPVQLDESYGDAGSYQADIAVGSDGTKYVVWADCVYGTACGLKLAIGKLADIQDFQVIGIGEVLGEYSYESPDIAVDNAGKVYLVYRAEPYSIAEINRSAAAGDAKFCYTIIDPANPGEPACNPLNDTSYPIKDLPYVAANGPHVFAVYEVKTEITPMDWNALRYRQLDPGGKASGWVNPEGGNPTGRHIQPALAVNRSGRLYVAWFEARPMNPPLNQHRFHMGCSTPDGGMVYPGAAVSDIPDTLGFPAVRLAPDESQVLVAYSTGTNIRTMHYHSSCECEGSVDASLPTGDPWKITGSPSIAAFSENGSKSVTVFAASDDKMDTEIWFKRYGYYHPQQVSFNDWEDLDPQLTHIEDGGGNHIVSLGWLAKKPAGETFTRDIYFTAILNTSVPRVVHQGAYTHGLKMDAHGQWIGAVWNAEGEGWEEGMAPWVSFNSFELLLPQMRK